MPHRGVHHLLAAAPPPGEATTAPGTTLPLGAEVGRQLRRRRTQITLAFLVALPFLLVLAFTLGADEEEDEDGQIGFVDLATSGAVNFTVFTLFVATGFLFVVVVALFAGDTVASEASWSSLRYLLAAPVPRSRLLRQKLVVALVSSVVALLTLAGSALLAGTLFFGWAPLQTPFGAVFDSGESLLRLGLALGYIVVSMLSVAGLAFLLTVWTDAPLGAVGGAVLITIISSILDAVDELGAWRQVLPTHYQLAWTDALQPAVVWESMTRGGLVALVYGSLLLAAAWWHFLRKDVVS